MKILAQVQPYVQDLKTGLMIKHISPFQEVVQWGNTLKKKFKRNTDGMPFVITCRAWQA